MDEKGAKDRYNDEYREENIRENIYSLINPIGKYDYYATTDMLSMFIEMLCDGSRNLSELSLLDVGSGDGRKSRIMAELVGDAKRISGFELSEEGVAYQRRLNDMIDCRVGNVVSDFPRYEKEFDGVIACCVFMFLRNDEDIIKSLKNIRNCMRKDGLFLWFDTNEKTHTEHEEDLYWGFSAKEMDGYAEQAGFELVKQSFLFRTLRFRGQDISTYYLVEKLGFIKAELINRIPFFRKSYNVRVYRIK